MNGSTASARGRNPRVSEFRKKKQARQRNWVAGGVAAAVALSWTVGGIIMPSMAVDVVSIDPQGTAITSVPYYGTPLLSPDDAKKKFEAMYSISVNGEAGKQPTEWGEVLDGSNTGTAENVKFYDNYHNLDKYPGGLLQRNNSSKATVMVTYNFKTTADLKNLACWVPGHKVVKTANTTTTAALGSSFIAGVSMAAPFPLTTSNTDTADNQTGTTSAGTSDTEEAPLGESATPVDGNNSPVSEEGTVESSTEQSGSAPAPSDDESIFVKDQTEQEGENAELNPETEVQPVEGQEVIGTYQVDIPAGQTLEQVGKQLVYSDYTALPTWFINTDPDNLLGWCTYEDVGGQWPTFYLRWDGSAWVRYQTSTSATIQTDPHRGGATQIYWTTKSRPASIPAGEEWVYADVPARVPAQSWLSSDGSHYSFCIEPYQGINTGGNWVPVFDQLSRMNDPSGSAGDQYPRYTTAVQQAKIQYLAKWMALNPGKFNLSGSFGVNYAKYYAVSMYWSLVFNKVVYSHNSNGSFLSLSEFKKQYLDAFDSWLQGEIAKHNGKLQTVSESLRNLRLQKTEGKDVIQDSNGKLWYPVQLVGYTEFNGDISDDLSFTVISPDGTTRNVTKDEALKGFWISADECDGKNPAEAAKVIAKGKVTVRGLTLSYTNSLKQQEQMQVLVEPVTFTLNGELSLPCFQSPRSIGTQAGVVSGASNNLTDAAVKAEKPAQKIDLQGTTTVFDNVSYKGLVPGKTYYLKSDLYKIDKNGSTSAVNYRPTTVDANGLIPVVADEDGTGMWYAKDTGAWRTLTYEEMKDASKFYFNEFLFDASDVSKPAVAKHVASPNAEGDSQTIEITIPDSVKIKVFKERRTDSLESGALQSALNNLTLRVAVRCVMPSGGLEYTWGTVPSTGGTATFGDKDYVDALPGASCQVIEELPWGDVELVDGYYYTLGANNARTQIRTMNGLVAASKDGSGRKIWYTQSPVFTADSNLSVEGFQSFVISNLYKKPGAILKVQKVVPGAADNPTLANKVWNVNVVCGTNTVGTLQLKAGETKSIEVRVPDNYRGVCSVREALTGDDLPGFNVSPVYAYTAGTGQIFGTPSVDSTNGVTNIWPLEPGDAGTVTITNNVTPKTEALQIVKNVNLDGQPSTNTNLGTFPVTVTCWDSSAKSKQVAHKELNLVPGAAAQTVEGLLANNYCEVEETGTSISDTMYKWSKLTMSVSGKAATKISDTKYGFTFTSGAVATLTNDYLHKEGSFSIKKVTAGADKAVAAGKSFTVGYNCVNPTTNEPVKNGNGSVSLTVNAQGESAEAPVGPFPTGTVCTLSESGSSSLYTFVPAFSAVSGSNTAAVSAEGTKAKVTIGDNTQTAANQQVKVLLTNTITKKSTTLTVSKAVDGSAKDAEALKDRTYEFSVTCTNPSSAVTAQNFPNSQMTQALTKALKAGESWTIDGIAAGTQCVIEESNKGDNPLGTTHRYAWSYGMNQGAPAAAEGKSVTVTFPANLEGTAANLGGKPVTYTGYASLTNYYDWQKANFLIKKENVAEIAGTNVSTRSYTFGWSCADAAPGEAKTGTVTLTPGQTSAAISALVGTTCKVWEVKPTDLPTGVTMNDPTWTVKDNGGNGSDVNLGTTTEDGNQVVSFKIKEGDANKVVAAATNTFDVKEIGFSLVKSFGEGGFEPVAGAAYGRPVADAQYKINIGYLCDLRDGTKLPGSKTLVPFGNNEADKTLSVSNKNLDPNGECVVWEESLSGTNYTVVPTWSAGDDVDVASTTIDGHANAYRFDLGTERVNVNLKNTYKPVYGKFSVTKVNADIPAADQDKVKIDTNKQYAITVKCIDSTNQNVTVYDGTIKAGQTLSSDDMKTGSFASGFPQGTVCEVQETQPTLPAGYGWSVSYGPKSGTTGTVTSTGSFQVAAESTNLTVQITNTFTRQTKQFKVNKTVTKPETQEGSTFEIPSGYSFEYECSDPTKGALKGDTITGKGDDALKVGAAGGESGLSKEIPYGYVCKISEITPKVANATFAKSLADNTTFTIDDDLTTDSVYTIEAKNTITQDLGGFTVTKKVVAPTNGWVEQEPEAYNFAYTCYADQGRTQKLLGPVDFSITKAEKDGIWGTYQTGKTLPVGAWCEVTEKDSSVVGIAPATTWVLNDNADATKLTNNFEAKTAVSNTSPLVQIVKGEDTARYFHATNTFTRKNVGVKVSKTLTADIASNDLSAKTFNFALSCYDSSQDAASRQNITANATVHADGVAADFDGVQIPYGYECTLTESGAEATGYLQALSASATGTSGTATTEVETSTEGQVITFKAISDTAVTVAAVNTYTRKPEINTDLYASGVKDLTVDESAQTFDLVDTIDYKGLVPGDYVLVGKLVDQEAASKVTTEEQAEALQAIASVGPKTFSVGATADGTQTLTFAKLAVSTIGAHPFGFTAFTKLAKAEDVNADGTLKEGKQWLAVHQIGNADSWKEDSLSRQSVKLGYFPKIGTTASAAENEEVHLVPAGKTATVYDTVRYDNLIAGESYVLYGRLVEKSTAKVLDDDTQTIEVPAGAEAPAIEGTIIDGQLNNVMSFTLQAADVKAGAQYVVQEYLFPAGTVIAAGGPSADQLKSFYATGADKGVLIAKHDDLEAQSQTIRTPSLATTAELDYAASAAANMDQDNGSFIVKDTVKFTDLKENQEYTVTGTLHVRENGEDQGALQVGGKDLTASVTFTPSKLSAQQGQVEATKDGLASGYVIVNFEVPVAAGKGKTVVAFETLKEGQVEFAAHVDITDEKQTVYLPEIATQVQGDQQGQVVSAGDSITIRDTVSYEGLYNNVNYTLEAKLYDRADFNGNTPGEPVGEATHTFNPGTANGSTVVTMTGVKITGGHSYVVFEKLYRSKDVTVSADNTKVTVDEGAKPVAVHTDKDDTKQILTSHQELKTNASVTSNNSGDKFVANPAAAFTVNDEVTFSGLLSSGTYTLSGELKIKDGSEKGASFSPAVTATKTLTAAEIAAGKATLTFNVSAEQAATLQGKAVVAFEKLTQTVGQTQVEVGVHEDINDKDQSVYTAQMGTTATDKSDGNSTFAAGQQDAVINDTVTFTGQLKPEQQYTLLALLWDGVANKQVEGIQETLTFTTGKDGLPVVDEKSSTSVVVPIALSADKLVANAKYVVLEYLFEGTKAGNANAQPDTEGAPVLKHDDKGSVPQTVTVPSLSTSAEFDEGGKVKAIDPLKSETVTINDAVSFSGLQVGKEYTITGTLRYKSDVTVGGTAYKAGDVVPGAQATPVTFTPASAAETSGTKTVVFTVPSTSLVGGSPVVVFENMTQGTNPVGSHEDLNDSAQTVYTPALATSAENAQGGKVLDGTQAAEIVDTVTWSGLAPAITKDGQTTGGTYTITGDLVYQSAGTLNDEQKTQVKAGDKVTGVSVTPATVTVGDKTSGTAEVRFSVPAEVIRALPEGMKLVVFERAYAGDKAEGTPVAVHQNIADQAQTVSVGKLKTKAADKADGDQLLINEGAATVVDTVSYNGLPANTDYLLVTKLVKKTDSSLVAWVKKDVTTSANGSGKWTSAEMTISDMSAYAGEELVVFEYLYPAESPISAVGGVGGTGVTVSGTVVARHEDLNDAEQTVKSLNIATDAKGASEGSLLDLIEWEKGGTITDTVTLTGLSEDTTYTLSGELMVKDGSANGKATGITATKTLSAAEVKAGKAELTFEVPAKSAAFTSGQDLVVFETLSVAGKTVATHHNINDGKQTVPTASEPTIGTTLSADGARTDTKTVPVIEKDTTSLIDVVTYHNLPRGNSPAFSYRLDAKLVQVAEDGTVTDLPGAVGSVNFAAEADGEGSINVPITLPKEARDALRPAMRLVAYETLYREDVTAGSQTKTDVKIAGHADAKDDAQAVTVKYEAKIGTVLSADGQRAKGSAVPVLSGLENDITLTDVVSYEGLRTDREYVVSGELMNKATGQSIGVVGHSQAFTPSTEDGTVEIQFTVTKEKLAELFGSLGNTGEVSLVAYEKLWLSENVNVTETSVTPKDGKTPEKTHEDINDSDQTVTITNGPSIGTMLTGEDGKAKQILLGQASTKLVDKVEYFNLRPNTTYTLVGKLMGSVDGTTKGADGKLAVVDTQAQSEPVTFTTGAAEAGATVVSGSENVEFTVSAQILKEYRKLVAFEYLFEGSSAGNAGSETRKHDDSEDEAQTVTVPAPALKTDAKASTKTNGSGRTTITINLGEGQVNEDVTITDTVRYENLVAGKKYALQGTLMVKSTDATRNNKALEYEGKTFTVAKEFTAETSTGTTPIVFEVPAAAIPTNGDSLVVFEKLWLTGSYDSVSDTKVTSTKDAELFHEDINDTAQTVEVTTPRFGDFDVKKVITSYFEDASKTTDNNSNVATVAHVEKQDLTFSFTWECVNPDKTVRKGKIENIKDGATSAKVTGIQDGAVCTVTEDASSVLQNLRAKTDVTWKLNGAEGQAVAGKPLSVSFTIGATVDNVKRYSWSLEADNAITSEPVIGTNTASNLGARTTQWGSEFPDTVYYANLPTGAYQLHTYLVKKLANGTFERVAGAEQYVTDLTVETGKTTGSIPVKMTMPGPDVVAAGDNLIVWEDLYQAGKVTVDGSTVTAEGEPYLIHHEEKTPRESGSTQWIDLIDNYGKFSIAKVVSKSDDTWTTEELPSEFSFAYDCKLPANYPTNLVRSGLELVKSGITVKAGETSQTFGDFPAGTTCTITESPVALPTSLVMETTWSQNAGTVDAGYTNGKSANTYNITIGEQQAITVTANNHFSKRTPHIGTTATVQGAGGEARGQLLVGQENTIVDTVEYSGLVKDREYTLKGELHYADDSSPVLNAAGQAIVVTKQVTAEVEGDAKGKWTMEFTGIPSPTTEQALARPIVVFEYLTEQVGTAAEPRPVAEHADPSDTNQTVSWQPLSPEIKTVAKVDDGDNATNDSTFMVGREMTITDTVTYAGFEPSIFSGPYDLVGQLMLKKGEQGEKLGQPVRVENVTVDATGTGTWTVEFKLTPAETANLQKGDTLVVFERLVKAGTDELVNEKTKHEDINDGNQAVVADVPTTTTPGTTPPPVESTTTTPSTPESPSTTTTPETPPVKGETTEPAPVNPPVLPAVTVPPAQPKLPPVLAHTGAQATVLGGLAVAMLAAGALIGIAARRRREKTEE